VSGYPLLLEGTRIHALVVGGGRVAERKVRALVASGAMVRVVSPAFTDGLHELAASTDRLTLLERAYERGDVGDALLVIAATNDAALNQCVARDAHHAVRLVNVADDPDAGNCVTVAAHHAGDLVIAVSAGGVPSAAARIRDRLAERIDARYAAAVGALAHLRGTLLSRGERDAWRRAVDALVTDRFCDEVERGTFADEVSRWQ
jgi:precorrin-2 dehydrogenase/sirohydrochlorin ferrochelatase